MSIFEAKSTFEMLIVRGQQACKLCGAYCVYIYGFRMGRIAVHESPNIRS